MSMHSDGIQELEHGLAAAYRSLIYGKHRHVTQGGGEKEEEEEEEEEGEVGVHLPHVLLKILSYLPLPDLCRMSEISRTWKELLADDRMWDALPPDAEARKSSPWILVVDRSHEFNIVHIHSNKLPAISVESPEKMCGAPYTYKICIQEPPPPAREWPNIGPSIRGYWYDVGFSPDVFIYSSVNPSPSGTTLRTSDYPNNITSEFVYSKPILDNSYRRWDVMRFKLKIDHVESQACGCVNKHSMLQTLMPLFPEIPRCVFPRKTTRDHSSLMGSSLRGIPYSKKMLRDDLRRGFLKFHHQELVASYNGIICFLLTPRKENTQSNRIRHKVWVINPLTEASKLLPNPPSWTTWAMDEEQDSHPLMGLRLTMSSTSTGSGYLVILHYAIISRMLVYNSESNVWTYHKSYNTITTTSLWPFVCKCNVLFKMNDTLRRLSGFDAEAGVAYELDPQAMPFELRGETTSSFDSFIYRTDANQPCSRFFVHEGRIIYVAPLIFDMRCGYVVHITHREAPHIVLRGFGVWELREDSHENIIRFVELSRTPQELWQSVKLLQQVHELRATFVHSFCATKGSICCTTMSYLLEQGPIERPGIETPVVYPLRSTIPPLVYDLCTNSWSSLQLNRTCVALCGVEPSPWAKV